MPVLFILPMSEINIEQISESLSSSCEPSFERTSLTRKVTALGDSEGANNRMDMACGMIVEEREKTCCKGFPKEGTDRDKVGCKLSVGGSILRPDSVILSSGY